MIRRVLAVVLFPLVAWLLLFLVSLVVFLPLEGAGKLLALVGLEIPSPGNVFNNAVLSVAAIVSLIGAAWVCRRIWRGA